MNSWTFKRTKDPEKSANEAVTSAANMCPKCGQPMTEISATKRKCKPCGIVERDE